jgi:hypothetical protein
MLRFARELISHIERGASGLVLLRADSAFLGREAARPPGCEPRFDYGRVEAKWTLVGGSRAAADARGAGQLVRLQSDLALGIEGAHGHALRRGEQAFCALYWAQELNCPHTVDQANARLASTSACDCTLPCRSSIITPRHACP